MVRPSASVMPVVLAVRVWPTCGVPVTVGPPVASLLAVSGPGTVSCRLSASGWPSAQNFSLLSQERVSTRMTTSPFWFGVTVSAQAWLLPGVARRTLDSAAPLTYTRPASMSR